MNDTSRPILRHVSGGFIVVEDWKPMYGKTVTKGFKTNGMSSPKWASMMSIGNDDNRQLCASVAHDFAYSKDGCTSRSVADKNLFKNLRRYGVDYIRSEAIYLAVRTFGSSHYEGDNDN